MSETMGVHSGPLSCSYAIRLPRVTRHALKSSQEQVLRVMQLRSGYLESRNDVARQE